MRIDIHVHMAPLDGVDGTYMSARLRRSWQSAMFAWTIKAWQLDKKRPARSYVKRIASWVEKSQLLDAAVILPIDGRYDSRGHFDRDATDVYVSNDCVHDLCARYPHLLPGASINPLRRDAVDETHRVREQGAVLIKLLPNTQNFDPLDSRCTAFFRAAAQARLPLLIHTGSEHTMPVAHQEYGHPSRLCRALDEGCTVIAAHSGMRGVSRSPETLPLFLELLTRYDNLYGDTSSLFSLPRLRYVGKLVGEQRLRGRLLHGSDYPVPILALPMARRIGFSKACKLSCSRNPLDRCAALAGAVGLDASIFSAARDVLLLPSTDHL